MFLANFLACSRFVDESLKIIDFRTLIVPLVSSCFYFGYFNLEKTQNYILTCDMTDLKLQRIKEHQFRTLLSAARMRSSEIY